MKSFKKLFKITFFFSVTKIKKYLTGSKKGDDNHAT